MDTLWVAYDGREWIYDILCSRRLHALARRMTAKGTHNDLYYEDCHPPVIYCTVFPFQFRYLLLNRLFSMKISTLDFLSILSSPTWAISNFPTPLKTSKPSIPGCTPPFLSPTWAFSIFLKPWLHCQLALTTTTMVPQRETRHIMASPHSGCADYHAL